MLTGAIPQYLNVEPKKSVKGQAAICDWISNTGSHMFSSMKVCSSPLVSNTVSHKISSIKESLVMGYHKFSSMTVSSNGLL